MATEPTPTPRRFATWLRLIRQARQAEGRECEQAAVRVVLALGAFCYLTLAIHPTSRHYQHAPQMIVAVSALYLVFAAIILANVIAVPNGLPYRRTLAMAVDVAVVTYALIAANEVGAPMYGAYLWLTIGNGFRYGKRQLYIANALSVAGFMLVLAMSTYWRQHAVLGYGLLSWLLLVPLYVSVLLDRMDHALLAAREADHAKGRFLANMSHELRTPLNAIIGYSEMLREDAEADERREEAKDLARIQGAGNHLLSLINEILDLSKLEAGRIELSDEPFLIEAVIAEVADTLRPAIRENGNELTVNLPDNPPEFFGDPLRLRQVLLNLLSNAAKFTHEGRIGMALRREAAADGAWVRISIEDTGIGMTDEQLGRLFQPFTQADSSTTRRYGGTGLGLTISRRLCELMGGTLVADSEFGLGSRFTVRIPDRRTPAQTQKSDRTDAGQRQDDSRTQSVVREIAGAGE